MNSERIRKLTAARLPETAQHGGSERGPGSIPLRIAGAFVRLRSPAGRQLLAWAMLLAGLVVQLVLVLVVGYLIDLGISLMELWAELARKHLEITLS